MFIFFQHYIQRQYFGGKNLKIVRKFEFVRFSSWIGKSDHVWIQKGPTKGCLFTFLQKRIRKFNTHCGNYWNLLSHFFFTKISWKQCIYYLLKKLQKSWFHEKLLWWEWIFRSSTVWNFKNFSVSQILREIDIWPFWVSKSAILTLFKVLDLDFGDFQPWKMA